MKKLMILGLVICLSGCAGMNDQFDCNVGSEGKCLPINKINKLADQGAFDNFHGLQGVVKGEVIAHKTAYGYPLAAYKGKPIRFGETVQRIWIAPYVDKTDNYHEPSYIYIIVKKGHWIGDPVHAIQN